MWRRHGVDMKGYGEDMGREGRQGLFYVGYGGYIGILEGGGRGEGEFKDI